MFDRVRNSSRSEPAFKVGDLVACIDEEHPADETEITLVMYREKAIRGAFIRNGRVVTGNLKTGWWYKLAHEKLHEYHESLLRKLRPGDEPGSLDELIKITKWEPNLKPLKKPEKVEELQSCASWQATERHGNARLGQAGRGAARRGMDEKVTLCLT